MKEKYCCVIIIPFRSKGHTWSPGPWSSSPCSSDFQEIAAGSDSCRSCSTRTRAGRPLWGRRRSQRRPRHLRDTGGCSANTPIAQRGKHQSLICIMQYIDKSIYSARLYLVIKVPKTKNKSSQSKSYLVICRGYFFINYTVGHWSKK